MRRLRKEEYLKKTENLDSARTWRLESRWGVVDSHSAAVCCCSRPMVGLFYKAVPVLADEDKIGGSAISYILSLKTSALYCRPPIGRSEQAKGEREQECEVRTDSLFEGPDHTTCEALFFQTSEYESICQRIDAQGAALAALPRAIWSEHDSKLIEGCRRCTALWL